MNLTPRQLGRFIHQVTTATGETLMQLYDRCHPTSSPEKRKKDITVWRKCYDLVKRQQDSR